MGKYFLLRTISTSTFLLASCFYASVASADDDAKHLAQVSERGIDVGYGVAKLIMAKSEPDRLNNPELPGDVSVILNNVENNYLDAQKTKLGYDIVSANSKLVVSVVSTALTLGSAGSAAPWIAIGSNMLTSAIDGGVNIKKEEVERKALAYMAKHEGALVGDLGTGDLDGKTIEEVAKVFKSVDAPEEDLNDRFPGKANEDAKNLARDVMAESLKNLGFQALKEARENREDLEQLSTEFSEFVENADKFRNVVNKTLTQHAKRLDDVEVAVESLNERMEVVNNRLSTHDKELNVLSDFMFTQMSAGQKVEALNGGMFSRRFQCSDGMSPSACEKRVETKSELIELYQAEAKVEQTVNAVAVFAKDINSVATIASNLGFESEFLNEAAGYASVASNAVSAFASGNYLGAIASVTGIFGGRKKSAEAIQMEFLKKQFEQVNKKLDAILDNQQKILDGLQSLSKQMDEHHRLLNERLDIVDFELKRISDASVLQLREGWIGCHKLYAEARKNSGSYDFNPNKVDFNSIEGVFKLRSDNSGAAPDCINYATDSFSSLFAKDFFGNFLSLRFTLDEESGADIYDISAIKLVDKNKYYSGSDLQNFLKNLYQPTHRILDFSQATYTDHAPFVGYGWGNIYHELINPAGTVLAKRELVKDPCEAGTGSDLICEQLIFGDSIQQPHYNSKSRLSVPAYYTMAMAISEWMLVVSRISDIKNTETDGITFFNNKTDLIENGLMNSNQSIQLLEGSEQALNYAIASKAILYGLPTAEAIHNILSHPDFENEQYKAVYEDVISVLEQNQYLRYNVMMYSLHERLVHKKYKLAENVYSTRPHTYRFAVNMINDDPIHEVLPLENMFHQDGEEDFFELKYNDDLSWPEFCVKDFSEDSVDPICVPVAPSDKFSSGDLIYPDKVHSMLEQRDKIRNRVYEYSAFKGIAQKELEFVFNYLPSN